MKIPLYNNSEERLAALLSASRRRADPLAVRALEEMQAKLPDCKERERSLNALGVPGTVAVLTGQQLGLFLGPMFTLYKALSAVKTAQALQAETGKRTVPIFWLQTEDHDFEEIRRVSLMNRESTEVILTANAELRDGSGSLNSALPNLSPVEYLRFDSSIEELHKVMVDSLGMFPGATLSLDMVRRWYYPGAAIAEAFAGLLAELTAGSGLLFVNPRHPAMIRASAPVIAKAIQDFESIARLLQKQSAQIEAGGGTVQVHVRDNSPLPFYHLNSAAGPRHRLIRTNFGWSALGAEEHKLGDSELSALLATSPERFSSSALLRPIVQDSLFPTAAYIGGNAELQYFRQIETLYGHFSLPVPLVIPRASYFLKERKVEKWLKAMQLSIEDFLLPETELFKKAVIGQNRGERDSENLRSLLEEGLEKLLKQVKTRFESLDPTLLGTLTKTENKVSRAFDSAIERYEKALLKKDEITNVRLQRLAAIFYPRGFPQERVYSPLTFLCRSGPDFVDSLLQAIEPYDGESKELLI